MTHQYESTERAKPLNCQAQHLVCRLTKRYIPWGTRFSWKTVSPKTPGRWPAPRFEQNPSSLEWRQRLAQVSEWALHLDVALENWLIVARQSQKKEAWQAVLRLAPGQFDDAALVQAIRHQLASQPDDLPLIEALVQAYERLGDPDPALSYLQQHAKTPATLEILAQLAERAGKPDIALQAWRRLLNEPSQATPERAMRAAVLALTHNRPDEGLAWLEASQQQPPTPEAATDYWRLTGQLAESRQRAPLAIAAYRKLLQSKDTQVSDFDGLIRLLLLDYPLEAAQVSAHAWERYRESRHLLEALTIYSGRGQWRAFAKLIKPLDPGTQANRETLAKLWKSPEFLRLVGTWHQNEGRMVEARRLFEAGLRVSPNSTDMQQALLWLFIDGNDTVSLRTLLATREQQWSRSSDVHDALASSYQALSLPQTALDRYLTPRFKDHENDFLWLMNYADALDQNQQADRAWRLRRHLLSREWQAARTGENGSRLTREQARQLWLTDAGLDQTRRIARTRLMLTQRPVTPPMCCVNCCVWTVTPVETSPTPLQRPLLAGYRMPGNTRPSGGFCGTNTRVASACAPTARYGPRLLLRWRRTTDLRAVSYWKPLTSACPVTTESMPL